MVKVPIQIVWDEPMFAELKAKVVVDQAISKADADKSWGGLTATKRTAFAKKYNEAVMEAVVEE